MWMAMAQKNRGYGQQTVRGLVVCGSVVLFSSSWVWGVERWLSHHAMSLEDLDMRLGLQI